MTFRLPFYSRKAQPHRTTPHSRRRRHSPIRTRKTRKLRLPLPNRHARPDRASQRHSYQCSRQCCRKWLKMDDCHRLELLHLQRPNSIRQAGRMPLRSRHQELPRQTHQNRQIRWRSWLGRKLLHPKKNTMPRSPHRKLLHGQSFWPGVSAKPSWQTSSGWYSYRRHCGVVGELEILASLCFWVNYGIFTSINRNSQLKSKHNLHNIFNQIYKLLYIR